MFVCPMIGNISSITGGIVSLGPPDGGVWVFAHECENIVDPMMKSTGISGNMCLKIFLIFPI
jgi:hypothetical protein